MAIFLSFLALILVGSTLLKTFSALVSHLYSSALSLFFSGNHLLSDHRDLRSFSQASILTSVSKVRIILIL